MAKKRKSGYTKQRNRIMDGIRRLKSKGYKTEMYFPTEKELRSTGVKGVELSILTRKLKSLTAKEIKARVIEESLSYTQEETNTPGFEPPTNVTEDYSFFDEVVIEQWRNTLEKFAKGACYNLLKAWVNTMIAENGIHNTAVMLEQGAQNGNILNREIAYNETEFTSYIANMMDYLPDQGILYKEQTLDKIDYLKAIADALEQDEDWENTV